MKRPRTTPETHRYKATLSVFFFAQRKLSGQELIEKARMQLLSGLANAAPIRCEEVNGNGGKQ